MSDFMLAEERIGEVSVMVQDYDDTVPSPPSPTLSPHPAAASKSVHLHISKNSHFQVDQFSGSGFLRRNMGGQQPMAKNLPAAVTQGEGHDTMG